MPRIKTAREVVPGDVLLGHRHVTSVYQVLPDRAYFATFVIYSGGTEFKTFLGFNDNHLVTLMY